MSDVTTVVLVDDHMLVRQGIRSLLEKESDIAVVGEAENFDSAVSVLKRHQPDVVLLDLQLPGANGADLCWKVAQVSPTTRMLILSAFLNPHLLKACLSAGARGYLMKDTENLDLASAVRLVAHGETIFDPRAIGFEHEIVGDSKHLFENLTPKEMQIISLVCLGFTNQEISNDLSISLNTVKTHIRSIMRKLECRNRTEITMRARELNLA